MIHAFGALFGVAAAIPLTRGLEQEMPLEFDDTSDRFSLLGSMVLWVFWPSIDWLDLGHPGPQRMRERRLRGYRAMGCELDSTQQPPSDGGLVRPLSVQ